LNGLPKSFFKEIALVSKRRKLHEKASEVAKRIAKKFKVYERTGLPLQNAITIVEDLIDIYIKNLINEEKAKEIKKDKNKKKVLLLPHCSRKYMDSRCKANFDPTLSTYYCRSCSKDCLVNKATQIGKAKGYDVYILPGGSCIKKILAEKKYDFIVGVACCEEIKLGGDYLEELGIAYLGVPLTKNGCSGTKFDVKFLERVL
jgi:hypothetical protein